MKAIEASLRMESMIRVLTEETLNKIAAGEVIENPENNTKEYLAQRAQELNEMNAAEFRLKAKALIEKYGRPS